MTSSLCLYFSPSSMQQPPHAATPAAAVDELSGEVSLYYSPCGLIFRTVVVHSSSRNL
ncbi:hypothetical protein Hanom_Chr01g00077511 [Helianthus anomalus]